MPSAAYNLDIWWSDKKGRMEKKDEDEDDDEDG
jgi:hypothetical protein